MTALNMTLTGDNTTATSFRAWGTGVDGTFVTVGWVRTSDTGQINFTSVAAPGATSTSMGYSVFRMNDTLQATQPVFLKIEYGSSAASTATPALWVTIGTGSDGAGNITGILRTRFHIAAGAAGHTGVCYFSGDSGRYACTLWPLSSNANLYMILSIERTKDAAGAVTSEGLLYFSGTYNIYSGNQSQFIPFTGSAPSGYTTWNAVVPTTTTNGSVGNTTAVWTVKCWTPGESVPSSNLFLYTYGDFTPNSPVVLTLYDGAYTGTYWPFNISSVGIGSTLWRGNSATNVGIMMRYE